MDFCGVCVWYEDWEWDWSHWMGRTVVVEQGPELFAFHDCSSGSRVQEMLAEEVVHLQTLSSSPHTPQLA